MNEESKNETRLTRTETLLGIWELLRSRYDEIDSTQVAISKPLIHKAVEHYLNDLAVLKLRYGINERIQLHKIAGLMAAAIMRYRPIVPIKDDLSGVANFYANELFAIMHGIAVCGEKMFSETPSNEINIFSENWYAAWEKDLIYLLHNRNYTADSLIFIFETLVFWKFPANIDIKSI